LRNDPREVYFVFNEEDFNDLAVVFEKDLKAQRDAGRTLPVTIKLCDDVNVDKLIRFVQAHDFKSVAKLM
jgi:hypothetical protein